MNFYIFSCLIFESKPKDTLRAKYPDIPNLYTIIYNCDCLSKYNDKLKSWFEGILTFSQFFLLFK